MAWNQPGNNGQDRDPWGSSNNNGGNSGGNNKGGRDQGPPDLDDIFRKLSKKLSSLGAGKALAAITAAARGLAVRISAAVSSVLPRLWSW
jgi:membrane protease subunit HflK